MFNDAVKRDISEDTMAPRKYKSLRKIVETEDKATGEITRTYIYGNDIEDEHIQRYMAKGLSRNAPLQRHVLRVVAWMILSKLLKRTIKMTYHSHIQQR